MSLASYVKTILAAMLLAPLASGLAAAVSNVTSNGTPALEPWQMAQLETSLSTHVVLAKTQFDHTAFPPSATNCTVRWLRAADEEPWGWAIMCADTAKPSSNYTILLLPGV
ncbi:hypothetical protein B0T24DRAFT_685499 [Lasiosphaeria ovina]|uniref:Secreted protein n=1 Tax=Lasiosphaeria ovina TaxID=92902 RepID=A0AAE0MXD2_9PEZI|nr:hypothetical protein B0T24DRAFT_685499 [Lasiosphaeria ovina]